MSQQLEFLFCLFWMDQIVTFVLLLLRIRGILYDLDVALLYVMKLVLVIIVSILLLLFV